MRRRGRRVETAPSLIINSMVDLFTFILVFLITFMDPNQSAASDEFTVPTARGERSADDDARAHLQVGPQFVKLEGTEIARFGDAGPDAGALDAVQEALAARVPVGPPQPGDPPVPLVVEVDRRVPWAALSPTLAAAERAGFSDFRFVVLQEEE